MSARRRLTSALAALLALAALAPAAPAQGSTEETLQRATRLYEDVQVERALTLLRQVISPSSPFEVSREQRVQAYKYLGASLAVLGQRDSALVYFRAALERDPFVDLDPQRFTEQERTVFGQARRLTFGVAARPIARTTFDPTVQQAVLPFITTHEATVRVEVRPAGASSGVAIFEGSNDGVRETSWNGVLAGGRLAPPGRYELLLLATSRLTQRVDSTRLYFELAHDFPPLEDPLPPLPASELLPERYPRSAGVKDFGRGLGVGVASLLVPVVAGSRLGDGGRAMALATAGAATGAGLVALVYRNGHRAIPANIAENERRRAARAVRNAEIAARNAARLAQTKLIIAPSAGTGR